jgi:uroporphyrinogen-III decarboxylase
MVELTSRERMLRALRREPPDYIPCCLMSFTALRRRCREDFYALVRAERAMGLDSFLFIPTAPRPARPDHPDLRGLPVRFDPAVETREWREEATGSFPVLHKEYTTPDGKLTASVRLAEDWPHGEHIPFVDDYQVSHGVKPLLTEAAELEILPYLLRPPAAEDIAAFQEEAEKARTFAEEEGVLVAGGWGVGADLANWLCGVQNFTLLVHDQPGFAVALLDMIHQWNLLRMSVVLSAPVDLYIRRAWYEGCDFLTPKFFREIMLPRLRKEVELAHANGALFGYICSSGTLPMLDCHIDAGVDVLIGVDPVQGTHTNLGQMKQKACGKLSFWGGVSGAVTVEMGSEDEVRAAVGRAIETLGPTGFILSPVDNITVDEPRTWNNIDVLVDEWRKRRQVSKEA